MAQSKLQTKQIESPSVNQDEVEKFSAMADEWWDETGKFKPLHKFNPVRIKYIRDNLIEHFGLDERSDQPLKGLKILDIGCGGGLLSVPMARLGAEMTSVDASEKNIKIAKAYAEKNLKENINFLHSSAEKLASTGAEFDVILNMEVIEHVEDVSSFMRSCCDMLKKGGLQFVATLNRTPKSYLFAIIGAEYVLRWLPQGTHEWSKFLKPSEINNMFESNGLKLKSSTGVKYNPLKDDFNLNKDLSVNYILIGEK